MFGHIGHELISISRYDADENAGSNNNAVPVPAIPQPSSNDIAMKANDAPGYGEEPEATYDVNSFEAEQHGHQEDTNGHHDEMQYHEMPEMQPQQERYNVNMKEDG